MANRQRVWLLAVAVGAVGLAWLALPAQVQDGGTPATVAGTVV